jgi:hypothetical protein
LWEGGRRTVDRDGQELYLGTGVAAEGLDKGRGEEGDGVKTAVGATR